MVFNCKTIFGSAYFATRCKSSVVALLPSGEADWLIDHVSKTIRLD